jgi:hypothetical protein
MKFIPRAQAKNALVVKSSRGSTIVRQMILID